MIKNKQNIYNGGLTAEKFLFFEVRIVAHQYLEGQPLEMIISNVTKENLFQFPTEREVSRMVRACYRRITSLNNRKLVYELAYAPTDIAKQINLYAIMCYNDLVREFMLDIIGEKYRQHDFSFTKKDINIFFSRLREQNDTVANWSEKTISKLKQVLTKFLIETEMLGGFDSTELYPIFISSELESGIRENKDLKALAAFNCFK